MFEIELNTKFVGSIDHLSCMSQRIRSLIHDLANTEEQTINKQLAATQDPLRYTFINIIHGLVEVGQMRGVSTEVLKQLLHTLGVKGKGPPKISQRIHLCLCCSPLWPRLPTWAASIFDVAQHLADCNKETDHCGG